MLGLKGLFLCLAAFVSYVCAHNELLPPHGKICYYDDLSAGDKLSVTFQVGTRDPSSSEQLDADFYILGPNGNRVLLLNRVTDGKPDYSADQSGRYQYCFSNEYSGTQHKDVTFHVNGIVATEARKESYHDNLEGQIKLLNRLMQDVKKEQEYIVIRERVHRNTAESTNERVKWWSLFQIAILVGNTLFQVFYLKRFFEVKSNV